MGGGGGGRRGNVVSLRKINFAIFDLPEMKYVGAQKYLAGHLEKIILSPGIIYIHSVLFVWMI